MRNQGLVAQRLLDTCAMGAPCLTDDNKGLSKYGLRIPTYTTNEDFMNKMKFYTQNENNLKLLQEEARAYSIEARKSDFVTVAEKIVCKLQTMKRI